MLHTKSATRLASRGRLRSAVEAATLSYLTDESCAALNAWMAGCISVLVKPQTAADRKAPTPVTGMFHILTKAEGTIGSKLWFHPQTVKTGSTTYCCISINQSINLSIYLSIYLSICLSVYLSVCLSVVSVQLSVRDKKCHIILFCTFFFKVSTQLWNIIIIT